MLNILITLKRVMRDIKASYWYKSYIDVNLTHFKNLLEFYKTHVMTLWFHKFRSSNLEDGFKKAFTLLDIITID